jgi:hypothetical protein
MQFLISKYVESLTYSMEQSPSWEANWFAASQEIPRILWNPKVPHRTHKRPPHRQKIYITSIWYTELQFCRHAMAAVQYTFTQKEYIEQHNRQKQYI